MLKSIMLGRGAVANPWLFAEVKGIKERSKPDKATLRAFHDQIDQSCRDVYRKRPDCPCGKPAKRHQDFYMELIVGSDKVEALKLNNKKTGEKSELKVDGVFVAVGIEPDSGQYAGQVETDNQGYIIAGEDGRTSVDGVFAAGDVRTKALRQIITAAADGANCITSAQSYLTRI